MNWIYNIPTWSLVVLSIIVYSIFGVGGMLLTRRWVRHLHKTDHSQNDVVSYFLAAASVFYGVTLGLITVGVWTNFSTAQEKVDAEAQAVAGLYRSAEGFDYPRRVLLQQDLLTYTDKVIHVTWPQQQRGMPAVGSGLMLEGLQRHILEFNPKTTADQILQSQVLAQFNLLAETRHARMDSVGVGIPSAMWSLVLLGAVITIAITWCFDLKSRPMHICMVLMMTSLLGLIIALTAAFDNPFRGDLSVSAEPFERTYRQMQEGMRIAALVQNHSAQLASR